VLAIVNKEKKYSMDFGRYLKKLREKRGLGIRQLSKYSGVSSAYISQIENGDRGTPSPRILQKLAAPLKVRLSELYDAAGYGENIFEEDDDTIASSIKETPQVTNDLIEELKSIIKRANELINPEEGN